jgi:transposase
MGKHLSMEKHTTIEVLLRQGRGVREICRLTRSSPKVVIRLQRTLADRETPLPEVPTGQDLDRETVASKVPTGSSTPDASRTSAGASDWIEEEEAPLARPTTRSKQIQPYTERIGQLVQQGLEARLIWRHLVEEYGFRGSEDSVKRWVRKLRRKSPTFFQHLAVRPGEEAQMDFLEGPRIWADSSRTVKRRCWILVLTLSHSGMSYRQVLCDQSERTVLEALTRGLEAWGGVPQWLKIDNFKAAVHKAHRYDPQISRQFLSWSAHYGIALSPCDPGKPNQKGRVERDCRYTRDSFLKPLSETLTQEELSRRLGIWEVAVARQRIHGRHKRQVQEVFLSEDKPALQALPARAFQMFSTALRKVSVHGTAEIEGVHYEVSHRLIGTQVEVHYDLREVRVHRQDDKGALHLVIRHERRYRKGEMVTAPAGHPSWMNRSRLEREEFYRAQAAAVGARCSAHVDAILGNGRGQHPRTHRRIQGLRRLQERFGVSILETACAKVAPHPDGAWRRLEEVCIALASTAAPAASRSPAAPSPELRDLAEYDALLEQLSLDLEVSR